MLCAGILQYELGKEGEAQQLFALGASLDPRVALPVKVSPRIEIVYERERARFAALMPNVVAPQVAQPLAVARPLPLAPPVAAVPAGAVEPTPTVRREAQGGTRGGKSKKVAGGVILGVGAAAAIAGGVCYGFAWSRYPKYQYGQATRADAEEMDLFFKAGVGGLIGGIAVAAVGVLLVSLPDGTSATASVAPVPGGAAFALQGTLP